jgi:pyrimidine operon attenuation protein/uracil phosphoribosyltransferase
MPRTARKLTTSEFVQLAELLDSAFPKAPAIPDYISHDCERAEAALAAARLQEADTGDEVLAKLLGIPLRSS